ncbi:MAG: hypothetical protein LRY35_05445 [Clostridiales bacterium]|nr:hypothetical protein [Clostridiales bacterium]
MPPELEPGQRTRFLPDGLFLVMLSAILVTAGWQRIQPLVLFILYVLSSFLMLVILLADWKTRIIPDPLTAGLALLALVHALVQIWHQGWSFTELGFRLLAGVLAGVLFLLIGWIGSRIAGRMPWVWAMSS